MKLITDSAELEKFTAPHRLWQGIPSIEVTERGRMFVTLYSGGWKEQFGNYTLLLQSDDNGMHFREIAAVYTPEGRCFDAALWIDPLKRLWFTFSACPEDVLYASICEDADADHPVFSEPRIIGKRVMMNKPTVLSNGDWVFPIAVWKEGIRSISDSYEDEDIPRGSFAYVTKDQGKTFTIAGTPDISDKHFDEHMFVEMESGALRCYVRTYHGVSASESFDEGATWSSEFDPGFSGPDSRFFIRRLRSGRILLINHYDFKGRDHLYAMLSEDDGKSFPYRLLLDERNGISYPDGKELSDGRIYMVYDRERGGYHETEEEALAEAREILCACFREEDILRGEIVSADGFRKRIVSKLTDYVGGDPLVDRRRKEKG